MLFALNSFAFIGNTNNGTTTDSIWDAANNIASPNATVFLASSNETVSSISAKVVGMTGKYKFAIYAGNNTTATTFLRGTSEITNPTNGWYSVPLTAPLSITNGQYYWLAAWGNAAPAAMYYTAGNTTVWKVLAYTTNWPSPFTQGGSFTANYCIYAFNTATNPPVTNTTGKVTLAWDPSPDSSVVGYKIYLGPVSAGYTNSVTFGNVTNATITGLVTGSTYYFAATAFDGSGLESVFSNETSYTVPLSTNQPSLNVPTVPTLLKVNKTTP